jgi:hypothetical protein
MNKNYKTTRNFRLETNLTIYYFMFSSNTQKNAYTYEGSGRITGTDNEGGKIKQKFLNYFAM